MAPERLDQWTREHRRPALFNHGANRRVQTTSRSWRVRSSNEATSRYLPHVDWWTRNYTAILICPSRSPPNAGKNLISATHADGSWVNYSQDIQTTVGSGVARSRVIDAWRNSFSRRNEGFYEHTSYRQRWTNPAHGIEVNSQGQECFPLYGRGQIAAHQTWVSWCNYGYNGTAALV